MKKILISFTTIVISCLIGLILLTTIFLIPGDLLKKNLSDSSRELILNIDNPSNPRLTYYYNSEIDYFTDSLMLLFASYNGSEPAISKAMNIYQISIDDYNPQQVLKSLSQENNHYNVTSYPRYWHGYLVFLRPLMIFLDYYKISYLMGFVQLTLFVAIIYLLSKKHPKMIIPTIAMYYFLNPPATMICMQYNTIVIITFISIIVLLLCENKVSNVFYYSMMFLLQGILIAFFDLLTYPMVSLGCSLTMYCYLNDKKDMDSQLIKLVIYFFVGYVGMWVSKWVIGYLLGNQNVIQSALNQLIFRTSNEAYGNRISFLDVLDKNFVTSKPLIYVEIILLFISLFYSLLKKHIIIKPHYVLIALIPFVWYFFTQNHSYIHSFFTYRNISVVFYSLQVYFAVLESK